MTLLVMGIVALLMLILHGHVQPGMQAAFGKSAGHAVDWMSVKPEDKALVHQV